MFAKPSPSLSLTLTSLTLSFSKTRVAFSGERAAPHGPPPLLSTAPHPRISSSRRRGSQIWSLPISPAIRFGFGVCLRRRGLVTVRWKVSWVEILLLFSLPFPLWSVSSPVVECFSSRFHVCLLHGLSCFPCRILYYIIFDWPYARPRCWCAIAVCVIEPASVCARV